MWNDDRVRDLLERFVPAADEVGRLQRGEDDECRLFQQVAEQGHHAGRSQPTSTRQGIYATAPSGRLLASINHNDPARVAQMLREALGAWRKLPESERYLPETPPARPANLRRLEDRYPEDGLALRVVSRDLPRRGDRGRDWRAAAWNIDFAWFTRAEVESWIGAAADAADGAERDAAPVETPEALIRRIARCHLVDQVRGQTPAFRDEWVREASLRLVRESAEEDAVTFRMAGRVRIDGTGRWIVEGRVPRGAPQEPADERLTFEAELLGSVTFDRATRRVTAFELVAAGPRSGATRYNGRHDDPGPAPMGVVLTLADGTPAERVAPAQIWSYGW